MVETFEAIQTFYARTLQERERSSKILEGWHTFLINILNKLTVSCSLCVPADKEIGKDILLYKRTKLNISLLTTLLIMHG